MVIGHGESVLPDSSLVTRHSSLLSMPSFDSFRTARWIRTLNLVLQAVLFITLFGGLNYLARNHSLRYDLTSQRR